MEKNISLAKNYFDFNGLNDLKNSAKKNEMKALKETAIQFEALFLQMMLKSMREATPRSELLDSEAIKTYEGMYDREVAISMAGRGSTGIADMLVKQLSRFVDAKSTKDLEGGQNEDHDDVEEGQTPATSSEEQGELLQRRR